MSDYYVKHLTTALSLAHASDIVDLTLQTGKTAGMLPLTVAVLDAGGQPGHRPGCAAGGMAETQEVLDGSGSHAVLN